MNVDGFVLIAADLEDFIFPLIVILFLAISALGQVLAKIREAQEGPQRRGPAPRPGGARPPVPRAADPLREEVDDFLRDSARPRVGGRAQKAQRPAPPPPPQPVRRPPGGGPQPRGAERPVDAELVPAAPEEASVAGHVRQHLSRQEFGSVTPDVGTRLPATGRTIGDHLHEVFDHDLGTLAATPGESSQTTQVMEAETPDDWIASMPVAAAAGLAAMLADPASLRKAVLLNEILQRPEHRWQ